MKQSLDESSGRRWNARDHLTYTPPIIALILFLLSWLFLISPIAKFIAVEVTLPLRPDIVAKMEFTPWQDAGTSGDPAWPEKNNTRTGTMNYPLYRVTIVQSKYGKGEDGKPELGYNGAELRWTRVVIWFVGTSIAGSMLAWIWIGWFRIRPETGRRLAAPEAGGGSKPTEITERIGKGSMDR